MDDRSGGLQRALPVAPILVDVGAREAEVAVRAPLPQRSGLMPCEARICHTRPLMAVVFWSDGEMLPDVWEASDGGRTWGAAFLKSCLEPQRGSPRIADSRLSVYDTRETRNSAIVAES